MMTIRNIILLSFLLVACNSGSGKAYAAIKPLWFSLAPANPATTVDCDMHPSASTENPQQPTVKQAARSTAKPSARPGGKPGGKPAGGSRYGKGNGKAPRFESEHRPMPKRNYWLNLKRPSPSLKAYIMRPDGKIASTTVQPLLKGVQVQIETPMGDGPSHGANNVYAVDRTIDNDMLVIRTAKWLSIHHSCGWGHDHKFDKSRQTSHSNSKIPLDIVVDNLWDKNFHSKVMSGDTINIKLLSNGLPATGAIVSITSDKGWKKTIKADKDGRAQVQMIRDHYPSNWFSFNRDTKSAFKLEARYQKDEQGLYDDIPYNKVQMLSTFAWRYYPARQEYHSYAWGLGIALAFSLISGLGVYVHRERRKRPLQEIVFDE